jgi:tRNA G18 (ribose-2'-O)-methylase SpoU
MIGYFGIALYHPKNEVNVGTLWRSAYIYEAAFIATIGRRYNPQSSDTVKADNKLPLFEYTTFDEFFQNIPKGCQLVAVEQYGKGMTDFEHPTRAIYLLGAEDHGLPQEIIQRCQYHIEIVTPRKISLNVATAGTLIMQDRFAQRE